MSLRDQVWQRDRGVCSECRYRTGPLGRRLVTLYWENRPEWERLRVVLKIPRARAVTGSIWDAHHIKPRCMGGADTLDNLATICLWCHRGETRKMYARYGPSQYLRHRAEGRP